MDTSVWSLVFRRSPPARTKEADLLRRSLDGDDIVFTTGLVVQELLQGFRGASDQERIVRDFSMLPVIVPSVDDHIEAARLRNHCRRRGVQVGTIDALIAQICVRHGLQLLTTDRDFRNMAGHCELSLLE